MSKVPSFEIKRMVSDLKYHDGLIKTFTLTEAPPEAGIPADCVALYIKSPSLESAQFFTPDEAIHIGLGLIAAATDEMGNYFEQYRKDKESKEDSNGK